MNFGIWRIVVGEGEGTKRGTEAATRMFMIIINHLLHHLHLLILLLLLLLLSSSIAEPR